MLGDAPQGARRHHLCQLSRAPFAAARRLHSARRRRAGAVGGGCGLWRVVARWKLALGRDNGEGVSTRPASVVDRLEDNLSARFQIRRRSGQWAGVDRSAVFGAPHSRPADDRLAGRLSVARGVFARQSTLMKDAAAKRGSFAHVCSVDVAQRVKVARSRLGASSRITIRYIPIRARNITMSSTMNIGITYDLKSDHADPTLPDDHQEEFDSPRTIDALARALEALGHHVTRLGDGRGFLEKVLAAPPDFVFNLAEGTGVSRAREARVPAVLEMLGIPHSGSDPLTLAATLDKACAKTLVAAAGMHVPAGYALAPCEPLDAVPAE